MLQSLMINKKLKNALQINKLQIVNKYHNYNLCHIPLHQEITLPFFPVITKKFNQCFKLGFNSM
jgi:hypothetical protein